MAEEHKTAEQRINAELKGRMADIRKLWAAQRRGQEEVPDLGNLYDYGLAFDYVEGGTDYNRDSGYFRWQLSWGGPGDEFRFYADAAGRVHRIEYWFLDWYEGAHRDLGGPDKKLLEEIFEDFKEVGATEEALKRE
jgi:hypothetical protein